jgi:hypothetical protein
MTPSNGFLSSKATEVPTKVPTANIANAIAQRFISMAPHEIQNGKNNTFHAERPDGLSISSETSSAADIVR